MQKKKEKGYYKVKGIISCVQEWEAVLILSYYFFFFLKKEDDIIIDL